MGDNAIHHAERDEHRSAVRAMTEMDRVQACGHYWNRRGTCVYCGEGADYA